MNARRLIIALSISFAVASVGTYALNKKLASRQAPPRPHLRYVATAQALEAGTTLRAAHLITIDWPSETPLAGAFLKPEDAIGRILMYPLVAGEPVLDRQLTVAGAGLGLSPRIPDGMRAISLKSDAIVGVAGFMLPGTHVDVLVTYRPDNGQDSITRDVLQDAQILAAGQKTQPDPEGKPVTVDVVTLLVTPKDAEKVVLASAQGTVHFVLRNGSDHAHIDDTPTRLSGNGAPAESRAPVRLTENKPLAVAPANAKHYAIQIKNGDKQTVETFQ